MNIQTFTGYSIFIGVLLLQIWVWEKSIYIFQMFQTFISNCGPVECIVLFPVSIINASQVHLILKGLLSVNSVLLNTSANVSNIDLKKKLE